MPALEAQSAGPSDYLKCLCVLLVGWQNPLWTPKRGLDGYSVALWSHSAISNVLYNKHAVLMPLSVCLQSGSKVLTQEYSKGPGR